MVVDGHVYRGIDGGAGDIGHIRVHDRADALCMCGSYGCLAAVASGRALAKELSGADGNAASGSDVRRLLAEGIRTRSGSPGRRAAGWARCSSPSSPCSIPGC